MRQNGLGDWLNEDHIDSGDPFEVAFDAIEYFCAGGNGACNRVVCLGVHAFLTSRGYAPDNDGAVALSAALSEKPCHVDKLRAAFELWFPDR
jgi:hypothetical protein